MSHSVCLKIRTNSWLSRYSSFLYRLKLSLHFRFRSIFRNFRFREGLQFSSVIVQTCALVLSANINNGKKTHARIIIGVLHSPNCLLPFFFFFLDSHGTYCVHFQTMKLNDIRQRFTTICLPAIRRIVLLQQFNSMQIR